MPNNEFLDPETDRASIISEVGSHSSALGINETKAEFERLPLVTDIADISNGALSPLDVPAAYGLPRGEGIVSPSRCRNSTARRSTITRTSRTSPAITSSPQR
ncbi:hypothetical protein ACFQFH_00255 [Halobaculum halobium]|uniref:hypothetical protein n=1 Tax=Halobaculum halobium TaxID=3032281 RepID=UPI00361344A5